MTPYRKLKSLQNAQQYLKPGITFAHMDTVEEAMSDTEFAVSMRKVKYQLMKQIDEKEAKEMPME